MTNYYSDVAIIINGSTFQSVIGYTWQEISSTGDQAVKPIFVMNSINPVGWRQGHKYVTGEFTVKGTMNIESVIGAGSTLTLGVTLSALCNDTQNHTCSESFGVAYIVPGVITYTDEAEATYSYRFQAPYCTRS
jgi:hypothetical protein